MEIKILGHSVIKDYGVAKNMEEKKNFNGNELMVWEFSEFVKYERSKKWYFIASAIVVLFLIYSVMTFNFLFAVIIIMAVMLFLMREKAFPGKIKIAILDTGIEIAGKFYPYSRLRNFSIIYDPPFVKRLYLEFASKINPRFSILLDGEDPNKLREILKKRLEEKNRESEAFTDAFARWLKL